MSQSRTKESHRHFFAGNHIDIAPLQAAGSDGSDTSPSSATAVSSRLLNLFRPTKLIQQDHRQQGLSSSPSSDNAKQRRRSSVGLGEMQNISKSGIRIHSFQDTEETFHQSTSPLKRQTSSPTFRSAGSPSGTFRSSVSSRQDNFDSLCLVAEHPEQKRVAMTVATALREILQVSEQAKKMEQEEAAPAPNVREAETKKAERAKMATALLQRVNAIQIADSNERKMVRALQDRVIQGLSNHLAETS